jgi:hypothetical protein
MQLITLDRVDELRLGVPRIVDRYDDGDPRFAEDVKRWIRDAEEILTAARLPAAASLAALRGTLIAAEEGTLPAGVTFSGRATPRKIRDAVAADVLRRADEQVVNATSSAAAQFDEAERLVRQMLPVAMQKGLIGSSAASSWAALENDANLGAIATHVVGLAGRNDALILLGRALQQT